MLKKLFFSSIVLISCTGINAIAAEGYVGANVAIVEYSEDGISDDASLTALIARLGADFNRYISSEVRLGTGVGNDTFIGTDLKIKSLLGAYVRTGAPISETVYPYLVFGYTRIELETSELGVSVNDSDNDLSYGIGIDIDVSDSATINAEYTNYYDEDSAKVKGLNFGIAFKF